MVAQIPRAQLESMAQRLKDIGPKADVRAVRLKFLEHKVGEEPKSLYLLFGLFYTLKLLALLFGLAFIA